MKYLLNLQIYRFRYYFTIICNDDEYKVDGPRQLFVMVSYMMYRT